MSRAPTNQEVEAHLQDLRARFGDTVSISTLTDIVEELITTLQSDVSAADLRVYADLESLSRYIKTAREEISALSPQDMHNKHFRPASDQLDAIVAATEDATSSILDSAEKITAAVETLDKGHVADTIAAEITRIYEACNFQDITGQRIEKVVATLGYIENKLVEIAHTFGCRDHDNPPPLPPDNTAESSEDGSLLNGPQMPGEATSQKDVDALLKR